VKEFKYLEYTVKKNGRQEGDSITGSRMEDKKEEKRNGEKECGFLMLV